MCCVALPCCLFDLACFFLPFFSSLIKTCIYIYLVDVYADVYVQIYCIYLVDVLSTATNEATVDSTINLHLVNDLVFLKGVRRGGGERGGGEGEVKSYS